jgi:hypothetical protein
MLACHHLFWMHKNKTKQGDDECWGLSLSSATNEK